VVAGSGSTQFVGSRTKKKVSEKNNEDFWEPTILQGGKRWTKLNSPASGSMQARSEKSFYNFSIASVSFGVQADTERLDLPI